MAPANAVEELMPWNATCGFSMSKQSYIIHHQESELQMDESTCLVCGQAIAFSGDVELAVAHYISGRVIAYMTSIVDIMKFFQDCDFHTR